jgi:hypothetical protein
MGLSIAPLLIHDDAVPPAAREALKAATSGPVERRTAALESAARVLYRETDLDCGEVRDLIGLPAPKSCG